MTLLPVVEVFGPTLQGEGMQVGVVTYFVRLGGCDFHCTWCDSLYAVVPNRAAPWKRLSVDEIVAALEALGGPEVARWVTLSGGNPALFDLSALVRALRGAGHRITVETQATKSPEWFNLCDAVTLSPKPPSAGNVTTHATLLQCVRACRDVEPTIKMVVFDEADMVYANGVAGLDEVADLNIVLTPGTQVAAEIGERERHALLVRQTEQVLRWRAGYPSLASARVVPQVHSLLWGMQRGV